MVDVFVHRLGRMLSRRRSGAVSAAGAAVFLAFAVAIAGRRPDPGRHLEGHDPGPTRSRHQGLGDLFDDGLAYAEARHVRPAQSLAFQAIRAFATRQAALGFFRDGGVATVALDTALRLCMPKLRTPSMRTPLRRFVAIAAISRIACALRRRRTAEAEPAAPAPPAAA
ncbi:MAG: hypothetical protein R6V44_17275 [Paracoccaceae bacterium]